MKRAAFVAAVAAGYRLDLIDYGRDSSGLLLSSGSGTMMAVMDHAPALRFCLDIDAQTDEARLGAFLQLAARHCAPIAIAGWFSITPPGPLLDAVVSCPDRRGWHAYVPGLSFPVEANHPTLGAFLAALSSRNSPN